MDGNVLGAIIGVAASGIMGLFGYHTKKHTSQMEAITNSISNIERVVTEIRIDLPTKYVTKQELLRHIESEEHWHERTTERLQQIQEELFSLRYHSTNNGHS